MSQQLKHIFDKSACLSKRQLKDYAAGSMGIEEQYAVEHHVTTCFFCSEALDGLTGNNDALVAVEELNNGFLKDHFSLINPQVHLNSIAPAVASNAIQRPARKKGNVQPLLKPSSVAAALILGFGLLWYMEFGKDKISAGPGIAANTAAPASAIPSGNETDQQASADQQAAGNSAPVQNIPAADGINAPAENQRSEPMRPQALVATNPDAGRLKPKADTENMGSLAATAGNVAAATPVAEAERIERLPARSTASVNTLTASALKKTTAPEPIVSQSADAATNKDEDRKTDDNAIDNADELFATGKYSAALSSYKRQMNPGGSKGQQYATLQAARCYISLGQKKNAVQLLQSLVDNGSGSSKRQARRMLKGMGENVTAE